MAAVRVLVVDDHRAFADALARRLATEPDLDVVGTATDADRALTLSRLLHPDVVTLDLDLGRGDDGLAVAWSIVELVPAPRVVVVTGSTDATMAVEAVRSGALSWVSKDASIVDLVTVVRGSALGESHIPPRLLGDVLRQVIRTGPEAAASDGLAELLTPRELDVLRCLMAGMSRTTIAGALFLASNTVRTHIQNLLGKLGVHSSLEAVAVARRAGVEPWSTSGA